MIAWPEINDHHVARPRVTMGSMYINNDRT